MPLYTIVAMDIFNGRESVVPGWAHVTDLEAAQAERQRLTETVAGHIFKLRKTTTVKR